MPQADLEQVFEADDDGVDLAAEALRILRQSWREIVCLTIVGAALVVGVALGLPDKYRSVAKILVQQQQVPFEFVRPTVTSFADERVSSITERALTAAVLVPMIQRLNLYPPDGATYVDRMRQDIEISTIDARVSDRASGQRVSTTVAFTIAFTAPGPLQAQAVVEELVALYLEENERARQQSVAATSLFLDKEAERIAAQIGEIETRLADFKRQNPYNLPGSSDIHLQLAGRAETELVSTENRINIVGQHIESLRTQLAAMDAAMDTDELVPEGVLSARSQLTKLELELAEARLRYAESHPDVQLLRRNVARLTTMADVDGSVRAPMNASPNSPWERQALVYQLESATAELAELELLRAELVDKRRLYDARLLEAPEIEREYRDLTRNYESAQQRYAEIRAKQMQAEIAEELELDHKAERFTVVEPPSLPLEPEGPRRKLLIVLGLSAALGGSFGLAWLRDLMSPALKSTRDVARMTEALVLTAVPYVVTPKEQARERWLFALVLAIACVAGAAMFAGGYALAPMLAERLL